MLAQAAFSQASRGRCAAFSALIATIATGEGGGIFAQLLKLGVTEAADDDDDGKGLYRKQQLYDDDESPTTRAKAESNGVGVAFAGFGGKPPISPK